MSRRHPSVVPDDPAGAHAPAHEGPATSHERELSREIDAAVDRFRRLILSVAARHHLEPSDLDEVMQDVRLRLWRSRGEVETLRALGASYVYRTAVTAALDILRARRARRTGRDAVAPLGDTLASPVVDPARALEDRELEDRVFRAVDRLAPNRRPVVRMHLAGYDREEIARALGWTVGKVRNLLSRGLADLRVLLGDTHSGADGNDD